MFQYPANQNKQQKHTELHFLYNANEPVDRGYTDRPENRLEVLVVDHNRVKQLVRRLATHLRNS